MVKVKCRPSHTSLLFEKSYTLTFLYGDEFTGKSNKSIAIYKMGVSSKEVDRSQRLDGR